MSQFHPTHCREALSMFSAATGVLNGLVGLKTALLERSSDGVEHNKQQERDETIRKSMEAVSPIPSWWTG